MIFNASGGSPNAITKDKVVNNFTTTEEGYVADARALKVLVDEYLTLKELSITGVSDYVNPVEDFRFFKIGNSVKASGFLSISNEIPTWKIFVNADTGLSTTLNGAAVEAFGSKAYVIQATGSGIATCSTKIPSGMYFLIF